MLDKDYSDKMLKTTKELLDMHNEKVNIARKEIENLPDEKQKAFLRNALNMALKGELSAQGFKEQLKGFKDANNNEG